MEEKKFVNFKKEELGVKEYIKKSLGKGRISDVTIEYTPVGEKVIVATNRPGLVIGRGGEKINEMTYVLKKKFNLDNPHIEIKEITEQWLDSQIVADSIAIELERKGSLKFKLIAYRSLTNIMKAGAMGAEIVLSGKLPSDRAKSWRFAQGYLKKTGEPSKVVDRSEAQATTLSGVVGIKVSILAPNAHIHDRVVIDDNLRNRIKGSGEPVEEIKQDAVKKKARTARKIKEDRR